MMDAARLPGATAVPRHPSRRAFLQSSAVAAAGAALLGPARAADAPKSDRLNVAVVGVNARGAANLDGVRGENIVALCDVDRKKSDPTVKAFPKAAFYADFRRMFDELHKSIDAVVVSTPDHTHAAIALAALRLGKPVYCEKPLAHTVEEVRAMMAAADKAGVATQMGTQIHASDNYRRAVEVIRAGVIGPVRKVQVWCNRRPDAGRLGQPAPVPEGLDWELWLGPVPSRPFTAVTHPTKNAWPTFDWRWWWEFGGGVLADMACHFTDLPFWALGLKSPTRVAATGKKLYEGDNDVPSILRVDYTFPADGDRPAIELSWFSGVEGPDLEGKRKFAGFPSGVLFEGDKGQLLCDYGRNLLLPDEKDFRRPEASIPASVGHHKEWLEAIRSGKGVTTCPFSYGGLLTQAVLLGNVAYRSGEVLEWDTRNGKTGSAKADEFLRTARRKDWPL